MKITIKRTLAIAMASVLCLQLAACGRTSDDTLAVVAEISSITVGTILPEIGNIVVVGEYMGTVEPNQRVNVLPRIPGEVQSVYFGVGDTVSAGDILFSIDATDIINNISSLEAQLEIQNATVRAAQTGVNLVDGSALQSQILSAGGGVNQAEFAISQAEQGIEQALLGIEQAQAAYDIASGSLSDTTILFEAGVVARVNLEQVEMAYLNAQTALERANSGYASATLALSQAQQAREQALEGQRIVTEEAPEEGRQRAQDALSQAEAARNATLLGIQTARERLNDATVRAPISGIVESRNVEPFGMASPGVPAFVISEQDSMTATFRVPGSSAEHLTIGDTITLNIGNSDYPGFITEISTVVNMSGMITVKANIPDFPDNLLGGNSVRIFADAERAENILLVPLDVVHYDRGVPFVFMAEDGIARRVPVETGIFDEHNIQIISGVDSGNRIISTWSARLTDGTAIEERVQP